MGMAPIGFNGDNQTTTFATLGSSLRFFPTGWIGAFTRILPDTSTPSPSICCTGNISRSNEYPKIIQRPDDLRTIASLELVPGGKSENVCRVHSAINGPGPDPAILWRQDEVRLR